MHSNSNQTNIIDNREYNIIIENSKYNLRIEIDQKYIYFILSNLNQSLEYNYKNKMDLLSITKKLEINYSIYSNLEIILKIFDNIYKKNKLLINIINDNSCNLLTIIFHIYKTFFYFNSLFFPFKSNENL